MLLLLKIFLPAGEPDTQLIEAGKSVLIVFNAGRVSRQGEIGSFETGRSCTVVWSLYIEGVMG